MTWVPSKLTKIGSISHLRLISVVVLILPVFASLNIFGQTSQCRILAPVAEFETFAGEGGDTSADGSVFYGQLYKTGEIKLWDARNGRLRTIFRGTESDGFSNVGGYSVNSDATIVAARTKKRGTVWIGEARTGNKLAEFKTPGFGNSSVSRLNPSGKTLFTGRHGGGAALWDTHSGRLIKSLTHPSLEYSPGSFYKYSTVDFSSSNSIVAIAFYAHIYLWNSKTGEFIKRLYTSEQINGKTVLYSNRSSIYALRFSPDGSLLASGGRDHRTQIWDVETGNLRASLPQGDRVLIVKFSMDGRFLATVSYDDRNIKLWDAGTGKYLYTVKGGKSSPFSITFSNPQTGLMAIPVKSAVEFREVATGSLVQRCNGIFGYFLPNGETFVSGSKAGGLRLFRIKGR
jgi:WD40 repeat protein